MILHFKVTRSPSLSYDGRRLDRAIDGTCAASDIRDMSFLQMLGVELIARTKRAELTQVCQALFCMFAGKLNDKAATEALMTIRDLMLPTYRSSPHDMQLSTEAFDRRKREEERSFFDWIESVYWQIPLYIPDSAIERTNDETYYFLSDRLKEAKSNIVVIVSRIWASEYDALAEDAFAFLCDNCDSYRFRKKADALADAIKEADSKVLESPYRYAELSKESEDMALAHMRSALLSRKPETIRSWGLHAQKSGAPESVKKLLAHAYVNAGANVFSAAT